jgi:hypothetical protein
MTCCECGEEVVTLRGSASEVIGFVRDRQSETLWKEKTGRVMCAKCVSKRLYGAPDPNQMSLA